MKLITSLILTFLASVFLLNVLAQDDRNQLPEGVKTHIEGSGQITGNMQYSPDEKELAVATNKGIWLYDARTGGEIALFSGHKGDVLAIAYAPNGKTLASAGRDETIRLWHSKTGENVAILTGHGGLVTAVAFSPDGKKLLSGSGDGTVRLWSIQTSKQLWSADTPQKQMLDEERKLPLPGVFRSNTPTRPVRSPFEMLALQWVLAVAYSADGKMLASSGSSDGTIQLWNANNGELIRTLKGHKEMVRTLAFSSDGKTLVSGSDDDTVRSWDTNTGRMLRTLSGHSNDVKSVAISRDGKMIASGSKDSSVRLWDAETGRFLPTLRGHYWEVKGVAISADGKTVASGDELGKIFIWDWKTLAKKQK
ncbi:MAG: WD40 repeat domain-containing protein [Candidatus Poribacteria bacterium]|nr:WD40 repeat domain-containing protein [Candidatus Poribacteria bacterium]